MRQSLSVSHVYPVNVTRLSGHVSAAPHACLASAKLAADTTLGANLRNVSPCRSDNSQRY